jgi:hypothetical protein
MTPADAPSWLRPVYFASLAVHAGIIALVLATGATNTGADSAPGNLLFSGLMLLPVLFAILPSMIALLSWWMCHRTGTAPSVGHMGLSTALAVFWLIAMTIGYWA